MIIVRQKIQFNSIEELEIDIEHLERVDLTDSMRSIREKMIQESMSESESSKYNKLLSLSAFMQSPVIYDNK